MEAEYVIVDEGPHSLGEGILWDGRCERLYWLDIGQKRLFHKPFGQPVRCLQLAGVPGTIALTSNPSQVLLPTDAGLFLCSIPDGEQRRLADYPEDSSQTRFNDGKCDPGGSLWVGTMHREGATGRGTLYRLNEALDFEPMLDGLSVPNGICWSRDGSILFHVDSPTRTIRGYHLRGSRPQVESSWPAVKTPADLGWPDGMTMDEEGNLWVAHWDGGCVACYNPSSGEEVDRLELPAPKVTSCWFGGPDRDILYVTTALGSADGGWADREKFPLSGAVFALRPGVKGVPENPCLIRGL